jgi:hypothetical protein
MQMKWRIRMAVLLSGLVLGACKAHTPPEQPPAPAQAKEPAVSSDSSILDQPIRHPSAEPPPPRCGEIECRLFDTPALALESVLQDNPLVLGVGEAHALKGSEGVESTTSRFTQQLLPVLAPRSSDLVIELMEPDRRCLKTTEQVRQEQKQVTEEQAASNQNEFVTLGHQAKQAGVQPHILYPSCAQYDRIVKAGEDSIFVMLETIATLTDQKAKAIVARNREQDNGDRLVVLYGGAVHNDLSPREGRESWSYGPSLAEHTGQRYVELDLIVREYIKDTEVWQSLPWYRHFDKSEHPDKVVLLNPGPRSFVLIFPARR